MQFEAADYDWKDFHTGLSPEREKRYQEVVEEIVKGLLDILKESSDGHSIYASVPNGMFSVGVVGDRRVYTPIVMLTYGQYPGSKHLKKISTTITNSLPVSRVLYDVRRKHTQ